MFSGKISVHLFHWIYHLIFLLHMKMYCLGSSPILRTTKINITSSTCLFYLLNSIYTNPNSVITNHLFPFLRRNSNNTSQLSNSLQIEKPSEPLSYAPYMISLWTNLSLFGMMWPPGIVLYYINVLSYTNCIIWLFNKVCLGKKTTTKKTCWHSNGVLVRLLMRAAVWRGGC